MSKPNPNIDKANKRPLSNQIQEALSGIDVCLMIDSGAFTVWTKNKQIDIEEYYQFYNKYSCGIDYIINLDVIPGKPYRKISTRDTELASQKGWENYLCLLDKGIDKNKLVHVFHQGDPFRWLWKLIDSKPKIMSLSPANDKTPGNRSYWIDECMKTCSVNGKSIVDFHGLGVTSIKLVKRYPWFSVDSARWRRVSGYGKLLLPYIKNNDFYWDQLDEIFISDDPRAKQYNSHWNNMTPNHQNKIKSIMGNYGFNLDEMKIDHTYRCCWNAFYFGKVQEKLNKRIFLAAVEPYSIIPVLQGWKKIETKQTLNILLSFEYIKNNGNQSYVFEELIKHKQKGDKQWQEEQDGQINQSSPNPITQPKKKRGKKPQSN
jgi:hypothetical protein